MNKNHKYAAVKSDVGVWMANPDRCESVARMIAIDVMIGFGMDLSDFRKRDQIICAISDRVNGTLDYVSNAAMTEGVGMVTNG